ncbi:hypothetical protein M6D93_09565 [Jatrophihabitans telluris]|uniref:DAGKc domain-containing protein n=1 Tax=Jatrophihabitans telluris TaxID=2038343 RepID=A0ABY4R3A2_9ACTN|nr:hypothetical protein M6D93_09565 [Jatrophihabitans telluris]
MINPKSGSGRGAELIELLRRELPDAEVVELEDGSDLIAQLRRVAPRARVLAVGGGDGTMTAGATVAVESGLPLLALTGGTFNHFTTDVGIEDPMRAIEAVRSGHTIAVDVGTVNGQLFVNTSSIGSYPAFVATREGLEHRLGKPLAAAVSVVRTLAREVPMTLLVDGRRHSSALVFVGNGGYQPTGFAPSWRPRLDDGLLDLRLLDVGRRWAALRIAMSLLTGRLERSPLYIEQRVASTEIVIVEGSTLLARDGEVSEDESRIRYGVMPGALRVFCPPAD